MKINKLLKIGFFAFNAISQASIIDNTFNATENIVDGAVNAAADVTQATKNRIKRAWNYNKISTQVIEDFDSCVENIKEFLANSSDKNILNSVNKNLKRLVTYFEKQSDNNRLDNKLASLLLTLNKAYALSASGHSKKLQNVMDHIVMIAKKRQGAFFRSAEQRFTDIYIALKKEEKKDNF